MTRALSGDARAAILPAVCALSIVALPIASVATAQSTPVIAFGDSISIGFREPGVSCDSPDSTAKGYGPHLEDQLDDAGQMVDVIPRGVCGELTSQAVSRIDEVLAEAAFQAQTGVVIVMEGTNDISKGNPPIGVETISQNLQLIAGKAAEEGWSPVYSGIIPYGPGADVQNRNGRAEFLAETMLEIATSEARPFADPFRDLTALPDVFTSLYDADGFHLNAAGNEILADSFLEPTLDALTDACDIAEPCVEDGPTLCLQDGRFQIDVEWTTADDEGVGFGEPQTADTGKFWFFGPDNLELLVKVLDARCFNGSEHFWVFYGALTDQQFAMTVTDKTTCARRVYFNPPGNMASVGDTAAFPAPCPEP